MAGQPARTEDPRWGELLSLMMGILTASRADDGCEIRAWMTTRYLWIRLRWPPQSPGKRPTVITQQTKARFVRKRLAEAGPQEAARYFTRYLCQPEISEVS